jgi:tetratricopeptide (TPR) repeat protein
MEQRDNHDFLLLGRLSPELTSEQRVRETVMTWFGRRIDGKNAKSEKIDKTEGTLSVPIISFDLEEEEVDDQQQRDITAASIAASADFNEAAAVANAAQHLKEIHKQAMKDLDEDRVDQALRLLERALNSHRRKYGEHHHLVGSALHNLGMVNFFDRRYDEALELFEEAIQIRTKSLGPDHPDAQASHMKIALIYFAKGELGKASQAFQQICKKYVKVLGYGHPQLAKIQNNIGVVAYECGDKERALQCFETAFEFQHKLLKEQEQCDYPDDHEVLSLATANTLTNMAFCYAKRSEFQQAMEMYEHAEEMLRLHLPRRHHRVLDVLQNLDHLVLTCGAEATFEDELLIPETEISVVCRTYDESTTKVERTCCGDVGYFSACFC